MKNTLLFLSLGLATVVSSCGPAAEDREAMHRRAKIFQDSIAAVIRASMDEAAAPAPGSAPVAPVDSSQMRAAANPTVK